MSNFLQVKVPHEVRAVLKEWAADFRNGPPGHPAHPGEWFVSELARMTKASAAPVAVQKFILSRLLTIAVGHTEIDNSTICDPKHRKAQQQMATEAAVIISWCSGFLEYESRSGLVVVHFPERAHSLPLAQEAKS